MLEPNRKDGNHGGMILNRTTDFWKDLEESQDTIQFLEPLLRENLPNSFEFYANEEHLQNQTTREIPHDGII